MKADVYAGDLALSERSLRTKERRTFVFRIEADADPDALLRIASQLNLANRAPLSVSLLRGGEEALNIEARIDELTAELADFIARKLAQLTCVRDTSCVVGDVDSREA